MEYFKQFCDDNKHLFKKEISLHDIVYEMYKNQFVCTDIERKKLYAFRNHKWECVEYFVLVDLLSTVRDLLCYYVNQSVSQSVCQGEDADIVACTKSIKLLESDAFKNGFIGSLLVRKFYDRNFLQKLDINADLIGFTNGVYDRKQMIFREGIWSDYISKTVGYDWIDYTFEEDVIKNIYEYLAQLDRFCHGTSNYLISFIKSVLDGTYNKKIHYWTNADGIIKNIKLMLGDYVGTIPAKELHYSSSPYFAEKQGVRLIIVDTLDNPIQNNIMKYTGHDFIMGKPLYGDPYCFKPMFKIVAVTDQNFCHDRIVFEKEEESKIIPNGALLWMILKNKL